MLPLKFCKMCFDSHMIHRFFSSDANAFLTSDWDSPNCLAIRERVTPALNAARTAFNFPCAKRGASAISTCLRLLVWDACFFKSRRALNRLRKVCKSVSTPSGFLPRRFISSRVAACRKSNSTSLKCFMALGRSLGRTCRCGSLSVVAFAAGDAEAVAVENRSGAVRSAGSRPMASACHRTVWIGNQHRLKTALPGGASDTWRTGSPPSGRAVSTFAEQRGYPYAPGSGGEKSFLLVRSFTRLASGGKRGNDSKRPWHFGQCQRCRIS